VGDTRDYVDWHDDYERPGSPLHRRLQEVIRLLRQALDDLPVGRVRVVSLCAGQGADVLGAADGHPRAADLVGRLVELDPRNAARARERVAEQGLDLEVIEGDAARSELYDGAVPADLVLACGIFGNISEPDIERTVRFLPRLCAPGAWMLWTRHPRDAALFERLQAWCEDAGFAPVDVTVDEDRHWGVGAYRLAASPLPFLRDQHLFTFLR
jgi:SAM-dependent methyltransferase